MGLIKTSPLFYISKGTATKTQPETVVLVHNFQGSIASLIRHQKLFNNLGYDVALFNIPMGSNKRYLPYLPSIKFNALNGFSYVWMEYIKQVLNEVSGDKILFAMSGPATSALVACRRRTDIKKVICDGGPFESFWESTYEMYKNVVGIKNHRLCSIATTAGVTLWGPKILEELKETLSFWPKEIPILSIRGGKDSIVPPAATDSVFRKHQHLSLRVELFPKAMHLEALKHFPEKYHSVVSDFLDISND